MSDSEQTIKALQDAKDTLLEQGWRQGSLGVPKGNGSVCAYGAILRANNDTYFNTIDDVAGLREFRDVINLRGYTCSHRNPYPKTQCVCEIPEWNDQTWRTLNEVIDAFDDAIRLVKEKSVTA